MHFLCCQGINYAYVAETSLLLVGRMLFSIAVRQQQERNLAVINALGSESKAGDKEAVFHALSVAAVVLDVSPGIQIGR